MKVAFLHENPGGYIGGAELTMQEFASSAPDGVEVVWGNEEADRVVIGNWFSERPSGFRYCHDMRAEIRDGDTPIFCSPLQKVKYGIDGHIIPPALNLSAYRPKTKKRRKGNIALGAWHNPGKGQRQLVEWQRANGPIDLYGEGQFIPLALNYCGPLDQAAVAPTLWKYHRFVHLPTALEPFGRAVVEAWAAGCKIVTNALVGARYFIEEDPAALDTAAEDFWKVVTA